MLRRPIVGVLLVLALSGSARAGEADLRIETARPVDLEGALRVVADGGSARLADAASGTHAVVGFDGVATIWTWRVANAHQPAGPVPLNVVQGPEGARSETIRLANATLAIDAAQGERLSLRIVPGEGARLAAVGAAGAGRPEWLARPVEHAYGAENPVVEQGETLGWSWDAGWAFLGTHDAFAAADATGFPFEAPPVVVVEGALALQAHGGNLTIRDASGERTIRLGNWTEGRDASVAGSRASVETWQWLVLRGETREARFLAGPKWGIGAPAVVYELDGAAAFHDATGDGSVNGTALDFDGATVRAAGTLVLEPAPPSLPGGPDAYAVRGDVTSVSVDGRPVYTASAGPARAVVVGATVALGAAALALAWKLFAALFTRIAPGALLDHPARRALLDAVAAEPGLHLRELQRRVDLAWGPFTFHLRMLEAGGHLRTAREGRYTIVHPRGSAGGPAIPHPVARRIYEAVPEAGATVTFGELRDRLGISRQLLMWHLRGLERKGLVRLARTPGRSYLVGRAAEASVPPPAETPAP